MNFLWISRETEYYSVNAMNQLKVPFEEEFLEMVSNDSTRNLFTDCKVGTSSISGLYCTGPVKMNWNLLDSLVIISH